MSVGRRTLTSTMKRTWNAIRSPFRRRKCDEEQLHDDYPSVSDSEFTDDEERRREWQRHLNRRATIASEGVTHFPAESEDFDNIVNDQWEYESEYNVSFPSESSIIDAFKEKKYEGFVNRPYAPPPPIKEEISYREQAGRFGSEQEKLERIVERRKSLHPTFDRSKNDSFSIKGDRSPRCYPKSVVKERVSEFERGSSRRRDSVHPQLKITDRHAVRRESSERSADYRAEGSVKRKVRKQIRHRRRAQDFSPDDSDVESVELKPTKYTVNLTMEDLNNIIKKNVSSAVKTIVSQESKPKKTLSPEESFSTESETIFSGSSSHSAEANLGGLLQKQMKAQLDKDKLKGIRRTSMAVGNLQKQEQFPIPYSQPKRPSMANLLSIFNQQQSPQVVVQETPHFTDIQQQHVPQVTFNLGDTQPPQHFVMTSEFDQQVPPCSKLPPRPPLRRNSLMPQFRRPSIIPASGTMGAIDVFDPIDHINPLNQAPQVSPPSLNPFNTISGFNTLTEDVASNPFHTVTPGGMSQAALNRLRTRRHTLAAIGTDNPLGIDSKLDQLNNALSLLDASIKQENNNDDDKKATKTKSSDDEGKNKTETNGNSQSGKTEQATRPLTIAEQIEALSKKKKKPKTPLKPGQMGLTGCARALLIITNVMFLLVGAGGLGVGVWMLMDPNIETYFDILNVDNSDQDFKMICYVLCVIGACLLFIGFMGCCGTIKSSKCMLTLFIILIALVTLAEAGLGTILMLHKDSTTAIPVLSALLSELGTTLRIQLTRSLVEKYDPETTVGSAWDLVQTQAECCGSNGPVDYKLSAWKNKTKDDAITIPNTCCVLVSKDAPEPEPSNMLLCQAGTIGFLHDTGCFDAMLAWFNNNSSILVAALITILAIEVFALIFAIAVCRKAHKDALKYKDTPGIN